MMNLWQRYAVICIDFWLALLPKQGQAEILFFYPQHKKPIKTAPESVREPS